MLVYYFVPFIVSNRYLLFWVSNGHNFVTVQNRTHVYMNFFHHKDLGNHLLQLCPKSWNTLYQVAQEDIIVTFFFIISGDLHFSNHRRWCCWNGWKIASGRWGDLSMYYILSLWWNFTCTCMRVHLSHLHSHYQNHTSTASGCSVRFYMQTLFQDRTLCYLRIKLILY